MYRDRLPQLSGRLFITDGGLETDLIFHHGVELPSFASYVLLQSEQGVATLGRYCNDYIDIAQQHGIGVILESATWRASRDWAEKVGTPPDVLAAANRKGVEMLLALRDRRGAEVDALVVSGCIGPRSDAYRPRSVTGADEAAEYHAAQVGWFRDAGADLVSAMTLTNLPEAVGVVRAAQAAGLPVVISFTVETDGRLPTGPSLREAIEEVDTLTSAGPAYYMINCAHPTHFQSALEPRAAWTARIRGLRCNASCKSHAELDESTQLDAGRPLELAGQYRALIETFPQINVLGGCCGTDHRHVREIAAACCSRGL